MKKANMTFNGAMRIWVACLILGSMASTSSAAELSCWASNLGQDKVIIMIQTDYSVCPPPLGSGTVYHVEKTNNRSTINGCLYNGHYPSGYTFVQSGGLECGAGSRGTWYLNRDPTGYDFTASTPVNVTYSGSAATTDPDGDTLQYSSPFNTVTVDRYTGNFNYTPPQDFEQTEQIWIYAEDGKGGLAYIFISVTVGDSTGQNQAPVFPTFTTTTTQGQIVGIGLTANDPESDPVTIELETNELPSHGTLMSISGLQNVYHYTPELSYVGNDQFAAIARDNMGNFTRTVFSIVVEALDPSGDDDQDGMLNGFELNYGFDPYDSLDANIDSDADGFSNLSEHEAHSNPRDQQSTPDLMNLVSYLVPIVNFLLFD